MYEKISTNAKSTVHFSFSGNVKEKRRKRNKSPPHTVVFQRNTQCQIEKCKPQTSKILIFFNILIIAIIIIINIKVRNPLIYKELRTLFFLHL